MQGAPKTYPIVAVGCGIALAACGGGGGNGAPVSAPADFNLQAGIANMVAHGLTTNVTLSGTAISNGTSTAFTGSGTYTLSPAVSGTFDGVAASSQTETISGTISVAGQSAPLTVSVTNYYATANSAFLGEVTAKEYDVAQSSFVYPTMIVGGSGGTLGTVSRYMDMTMSVSLGTAQLNYAVMAPVDFGSPVGITLTNKIHDPQNALTETDVTKYTMTSGNVISFVSASAQTPSGTVTATAQ